MLGEEEGGLDDDVFLVHFYSAGCPAFSFSIFDFQAFPVSNPFSPSSRGPEAAEKRRSRAKPDVFFGDVLVFFVLLQ